MGIGFRVGIDVAVSLGFGTGIGYLLDSWLGTRPWLLVVFFFLGAGAGILNVYRAVMGMGYAVGYRPSTGGSKAEPPAAMPPGDGSKSGGVAAASEGDEKSGGRR
jgi:ATP synthase protein I